MGFAAGPTRTHAQDGGEYTPDDPLEKARITFDGWSFDAKGNRHDIDKNRRATLATILDGFGPGGLVTLGRKVKNSYSVIETLGAIEITRHELEAAATASLMDSPDDLTLGLITILNARFGNEATKDWITGARPAHPLSDRAVARLLTALPDDRGT